MLQGWIQIALTLLILVAVTPLFGRYMARVFQEMGNTIIERQNGMKSQLSKMREEKDEAKKAALSLQTGQTYSLPSLLSRSRAARSK